MYTEFFIKVGNYKHVHAARTNAVHKINECAISIGNHMNSSASWEIIARVVYGTFV